jgi:exodeoxyribonuclease V alpha subunit
VKLFRIGEVYCGDSERSDQPVLGNVEGVPLRSLLGRPEHRVAALNPAGDRKVERFGWTFAPGDKVMQIENDYDKEVYNGDIGYIDDVDNNAGEIVASFDGRSVTYGFGELDMLVPAYAATIHKSQGSEYPAVIIPVLTQHYAMLQRNLLYTGVTRGK